jgi:hypothetical protein
LKLKFLLQIDLSVLKMYEKTTCQFQIKFITEDYLQMYKTLKLFTNTFTFYTNKLTSIKAIKNIYAQTKSF